MTRPGLVSLVLLVAGCDPYERWPEPGTVYPWVSTPEKGLEPFEEVRWETGTWDPAVDLETVGLYALKAIEHRRGAPPETFIHHGVMRTVLPPLVPGDVTLSLVGDVMWTGGNWSHTYDGIGHVLDGDVRLGNLETPLSDAHPTTLGELPPYSFNAPTALLDSLPLDIVQVNNNHTLDLGDAALDDTLAALQAADIAAVGVDSPGTLLEVDGVALGVVAYSWGHNQRDAVTAHELFVIPFGELDARVDLSRVDADVGALRDAGAELVVALVHWGFEYEYFADPHFMVLGRRMLSAGVDLVVGSGPHVLQPVELCTVNFPSAIPGVGVCSVRSDDGEPRIGAILYSLGNFGAQPTFNTLPTEVGLVASVSLAPGIGVTGLGWQAVASIREGDGEAVVPFEEGLDDPAWADEAARLNQHLGVRWKR